MVEPAKIADIDFAPLGAHMPHTAVRNLQQALDNIAFASKELTRWFNSTAWVNDTVKAEGYSSIDAPLLFAMSKLVNAENAALVAEQLLELLKAYDRWSCAIFRTPGEYFALIGDLAMAQVLIADKLLPYAQDNMEALVLLKTVSVVSKTDFSLPTILEISRHVPHWTEEQLIKEKEEEAEISERYTAWQAERAKDEDSILV